ncbi:MAG: DUF4125 family protein [Acidaminococcaceae bacterium]|nr:DUF4125 family protein [Acidaminococcaceae bacterium]
MSCSCGCNRRCYSEQEKNELLEKIIAIEAEMFVKVNEGQSDKVECQKQLKTFHAMRYMSFAVLSGETLQAYWEDLQFALQDERNLVMEKYARMDDLIPVINESGMIDDIVAVEVEWMTDLHARYPLSINMSPAFARYARCELETYSDQTLELYLRDVLEAKKMNINLVEERYKILYRGMGFKSLEEVEAKAAAQKRATD